MPSSTSINIEEQQTNKFHKLDLLWLVITVLVFAGLVKLGYWQNSRALEKEKRLARIEQLKQQKAISIEQVLTISATENINDYPVLLKGSFAQDIVFLLDNQVNTGRLGYRVLQVLNTNKYSVLVNLGWIAGSINRDELPEVATLKGEHQFVGHIRLPELGMQLMEQNFNQPKWPLRVQQLELDKFSTLLTQELLPFVIYVDKSESIGFKKNWQPIVMPPEKHRGYAFQWFSLATAWLLLMCWAKFGHNKKKRAS